MNEFKVKMDHAEDPLLDADEEAKVAGPGAVDLKAGTAAPETVGLKAEPAVPEVVAPEAGPAAPEAVAPEAGSSEETDPREHRQFTQQSLAESWRDRHFLVDLLNRGVAGIPFTAEERAHYLHVCIKTKSIEGLQKLLDNGGVDAANSEGYPVLGEALRRGWPEGADAALEAGASLTIECNEVGDTALHCIARYFGKYEYKDIWDISDKIIKVAKSRGELDYYNKKGVTPLCVAIQENNLDAVEAFLDQEANINDISRINDSVLHVAANHPTILKYLLDEYDYIAFKSDLYNKNGYTYLHIAICCKQLLSFELLADLSIAHLPWENTLNTDKSCLHLAVENESVEIIEAIFKRLEKKGVKELSKHELMTHIDKSENTPFQAAIQGKNREIVEYFLCHGAAVLSDKNKNDITALDTITTTFNDPSDLFHNVFDNYISTYSGEDKIDYNLFTDGQDTSQLKVIEKFIHHDQSDLLLHPLISSFIYIKWKYFLLPFYVMIAVHVVFLITFNIFVANTFYFRDMTQTANDTVSVNRARADEDSNYLWYWMVVLMYALLAVFTVQEIFFIYIKRLHYFTDWETGVRLGFLVLATFLSVVLCCAEPADWQRHVACAALLLAWLQAMLLLSGFPDLGIYVVMFWRVAMKILKILATMIFLIVSFSICFMIQYRREPPFNEPFAAFFKTQVMMSSEFDYEGLFGHDHSMTNSEFKNEGPLGKDHEHQDSEHLITLIMVRLLFGLFVIFVATALMNFMIGVAVNDIEKLAAHGEKRRLEKQVKLLSIVEDFIYEGMFAKMFNIVLSRGRYYEKTIFSATKKTKWAVTSRVNSRDDKKTTPLVFHVQPCCKLRESIVKIRQAKKLLEEKKEVHATINKMKELHDALLNKPQAGEEKSDEYWVIEEMLNQDKNMKSLEDSLQEVSLNIEQKIKCSNDDLNSKIENLVSDIACFNVTTTNKIEEFHDTFRKADDDKGDKDWVREVISKQDEKIKSLADDLRRVSLQIKLSFEDLNSKIEQLMTIKKL